MSDKQKLDEQAESNKVYVTPDLTVYGTVEELTQGNQGNHSTDAGSGIVAQGKKAPVTPTRKP